MKEWKAFQPSQGLEFLGLSIEGTGNRTRGAMHYGVSWHVVPDEVVNVVNYDYRNQSPHPILQTQPTLFGLGTHVIPEATAIELGPPIEGTGNRTRGAMHHGVSWHAVSDGYPSSVSGLIMQAYLFAPKMENP